MTQQHQLLGILVVEDDAALRINILNYLICAGYTVKGVCSAIEFYREFLMAPYAINCPAWIRFERHSRFLFTQRANNWKFFQVATSSVNQRYYFLKIL